MNRRGFLKGSLLGLGSSPLLTTLSCSAEDIAAPFALGIASGDITDHSAVLWTRLAPEPLAEAGGMPPARVAVRWQISRRPDMSQVVQQGETVATPELAHSVHIELDALQPATEYWYQFTVSKHKSPVGRTRTLPAATADAAPLRFVTASCQNYSHGYFVAYEQMLADQPDFVIHLGDYIYDTSFGENFRSHETEQPPLTLDAFRRRHALYKTDTQLQRAHAQLPFFTTIDNHDAVEDASPETLTQRAAAYQAWYEHMPVRGYPGIGENRFDLQRKITAGRLLQICLLDARQFRDKREICANNAYPNFGFGNYRERCEQVFADSRTMLGAAQDRWLKDSLAGHKCDWNVLASPGPLQPFEYRHDGKDLRYIGAWDAYPANRARVAAALLANDISHPLILSGDVHSFWAVDGRDTQNPAERFPVTEFVTSSISANWPEPLARPVTENLAHNPQVKFYEPEKRGYMLHDVSQNEWRTSARAVQDVFDQRSATVTRAEFLVRKGVPGFERL